jgi:hypothetical protein
MYDFNAAVKPISLRDLNAQHMQDVANQQQIKEGSIRLSELGQAQKDKQALRDAYAKASQAGVSTQVQQSGLTFGDQSTPGSTPTVKGPGLDQGVLLSELGKTAPHLVPQVQAEIAAQQQAQLKQQAEAQKLSLEQQQQKLALASNHIQRFASIFSQVKDTQSYVAAVQQAQSEGIPENYPPQYDPNWVQAHVNGAVPVVEQLKNAQKATEIKIQQQNADTTAAGQKATAQHYKNMDANAANNQDSAPALTPEGVDMTAKNFALTGNLPPLGMGKQGAKMRSQVINRAAEMYPAADLATNRAAYAANKSSLEAAQKNLDAVTAFEGTASKNLDLFLDKAKAVTDTGSPWLNAPIRSVNKNALGSKEQVAYEAARQVALTEIAKVTNNPALTGTLSDSARHEIMSFNPDNATYAQTVAIAKVLKQDMANRKASLTDQVGAISKRIGGAGGTIYARDQQGVLHKADAGTPLPAGWKQEQQ